MTYQEILEKAIQEAVSRGWTFFEDCTLLPTGDWIIPESITVWNSFLVEKLHIPQQCVIFNHDFAKALWGEEPADRIDVNAHKWSMHDIMMAQAAWRAHLQQMVVSDDPIEYLGNHLS